MHASKNHICILIFKFMTNMQVGLGKDDNTARISETLLTNFVLIYFIMNV